MLKAMPWLPYEIFVPAAWFQFWLNCVAASAAVKSMLYVHAFKPGLGLQVEFVGLHDVKVWATTGVTSADAAATKAFEETILSLNQLRTIVAPFRTSEQWQAETSVD